MEFPNDSVPLNSPFYIERDPIETQVKEEIHTPGALIRIKGPKKIGKTSLLYRVIYYAQKQNFKYISLNLEQIDRTILGNLNRFLRWICTKSSRSLGLKPQLDDYWDEDIGSKLSCTTYFEEYLLEEIEDPIVLAIDEVNQIFAHPEVAQDFFPLLRSWHEEAKRVPNWEKLRIVVSHSTEIYVSLKISQSPFNVGLPVKLPEFTLEQIKDLALRHGLNWDTDEEVLKLNNLLGGHPYLIRLALYYISQNELTLEQLLHDAPQTGSIYAEHLRRYLNLIREDKELAITLNTIISDTNGENINLDPILSYKLDSLGLVKFDGKRWLPLCNLYRLYFSNHTLIKHLSNDDVNLLLQENQKLKDLVNIDELTQIYNRRYFNHYLETQWQRMAREQSFLSLILIDIDYFKSYNDTYGHPEGDICLNKVAKTIKDSVNRSSDLVARYGGEEFGVILPRTDAPGGMHIAETIRKMVKSLGIEHLESNGNQVVTISLGVASIVPSINTKPTIFIHIADQALYQSKQQGRDRSTLGYISSYDETCKLDEKGLDGLKT